MTQIKSTRSDKPITTYRQLEVWQVSIEMVITIYDLTKQFPSDERYGLTSQLRQAAVSVPANIAEGWGRTHRGDYLHHLSISKGSLMEVETHLIIAHRLQYISKKDVETAWNLSQQVGRMLTSLMMSMQSRSNAKTPNAKRQTPNVQDMAAVSTE